MQMNLRNVEKRDLDTNVSIKKKKTRNESHECREKRLANRRECVKKKRLQIKPLLIKQENSMLLCLKVQCTVVLIVISYGTNTVLLLLRN